MSGSFFNPKITRRVVVAVTGVTVDNRIPCRPRCRVRTHAIDKPVTREREGMAEVVIAGGGGRTRGCEQGAAGHERIARVSS